MVAALATEEEFAAFRETPGIFRTAAAPYSRDPQAFLPGRCRQRCRCNSSFCQDCRSLQGVGGCCCQFRRTSTIAGSGGNRPCIRASGVHRCR